MTAPVFELWLLNQDGLDFVKSTHLTKKHLPSCRSIMWDIEEEQEETGKPLIDKMSSEDAFYDTSGKPILPDNLSGFVVRSKDEAVENFVYDNGDDSHINLRISDVKMTETMRMFWENVRTGAHAFSSDISVEYPDFQYQALTQATKQQRIRETNVFTKYMREVGFHETETPRTLSCIHTYNSKNIW